MLAHRNGDNMSIEGRRERDTKVGRILLWEGRVSRGRLVSDLGLSPIRASEWLRDFRESFPTWVAWDSRRKAYVATANAYADLEQDVATTRPDLRAMLEPYAPPLSGKPLSVSWDFVRSSPRVFSRVSLAIADRRQLKFLYCSMTHPQVHERIIEPHSLVRAGRRWHVRGYCMTRQAFRDFVLGRMSDLQLLSDSCETEVANDEAWTTLINVRLTAHPGLSAAQQQVVRSELFGGASARVEGCRAALLSYMVQELMAATDVEHQRPPDYQLAVENMEDCRTWLFPR